MLQPTSSRPWEGLLTLIVEDLTRPEALKEFLQLIGAALQRLPQIGPVLIAWRRGKITSAFRLLQSKECDAPAPVPIDNQIPLTIPPLPASGGFVLAPLPDQGGVYVRLPHPDPIELWVISEHGRDLRAILEDPLIAVWLRTALRFARIGALRHRHLDTQVDDLAAATFKSPSEQIQPARRILAELALEPVNCLDIAARLGYLILSQLLDAQLSDREAIAACTLRDLRLAHAQWCEQPDKDGWGDKVLALIACLAALAGELPPAMEPQNKALRLLPIWVRQYERWRTRAGGDPQAWTEDVARTRPALVQWIIDETRAWGEPTGEEARHGQAPGESRPRHGEAQPQRRRNRLISLRNFHTIWFVLRQLDNPQMEDARAAMAHELREGLRFLCFQHRRGDLGPLRELVASHARAVIGGHVDIDRLLLAIGAEGGVNHYIAQDHLRHVLDIYVTGHNLLSSRLESNGAARTVSDELFRAAVDDGLRAFSLAALFHDVDLLFNRDRSRIGDRFLRVMWGQDFGERPEYQHEMASVLDRLSTEPRGESCSGLAAQLAHEITEFLWPAAEQPGHPARAEGAEQAADPLHGWLDQQGRELPHGALSAWMLLRMCQRRARPEARRVLTIAVRSILLHEAFALPIDLSRDPVAGLLVLLNEIFVWDPRRTQDEVSEPRIIPMGMRFALLGDQLAAFLDLPVQEGTPQPWPRLRLVLDSGESQVTRHRVPVWQIWLRKAINVSRLHPRGASGFCPAFEIISTIPGVLREAGRDTRWALLKAAPAIWAERGAELTAWLESLPREAPDPTVVRSDEEVVLIGPTGQPPPLLTDDEQRRATRSYHEWIRLLQLEQESAREQAQRGPAPAPPAQMLLPPAQDAPKAAPPAGSEIFLLYSELDQRFRAEFERQWRGANLSAQLSERSPGDDLTVAERKLDRAAVVLALLSADLTSDADLVQLWRRAVETQRRTVPVLVRDVDHAWLTRGQSVLFAGSPLAGRDHDAAWVTVIAELKRALAAACGPTT